MFKRKSDDFFYSKTDDHQQAQLCPAKMSTPAVVMRLLASSYTVAGKAGAIVRKVLHTGELGIVEKVRHCLTFSGHLPDLNCTL